MLYYITANSHVFLVKGKKITHNIEAYGIFHHFSRWKDDKWVDLFEMYKQSIAFSKRQKTYLLPLSCPRPEEPLLKLRGIPHSAF